MNPRGRDFKVTVAPSDPPSGSLGEGQVSERQYFMKKISGIPVGGDSSPK